MEHDRLYRDIEDCDEDCATKETMQHYASSNVKRLMSSRVPLYIIIFALTVALIIVSHRKPSSQDPSQMIYCRYHEHFPKYWRLPAYFSKLLRRMQSNIRLRYLRKTLWRRARIWLKRKTGSLQMRLMRYGKIFFSVSILRSYKWNSIQLTSEMYSRDY